MHSRARKGHTVKNYGGPDLNLSECGGGVVGQPANPLTGVTVVERVTSVGGVQTQVTASLFSRNILRGKKKIMSFIKDTIRQFGN